LELTIIVTPQTMRYSPLSELAFNLTENWSKDTSVAVIAREALMGGWALNGRNYWGR
jgi:hypothetical protein